MWGRCVSPDCLEFLKIVVVDDFAKIGGLKVYYTVRGQGPAVFLLHGWGGSSKSLEELQRELAEFGFKVYALDLPGFGQTPPPSRAWSVGDYAQLVRAFVEEQDEREFFLFGHSFGGRVAVKLASFKPVGLKKLVLCGAPVIREKTVKRFVFIAAAKILGLVFGLPVLSLGRGTVRYLAYKLAGERDYYQAKGLMRDIFKNTVGENLRPCLKEIAVPTLILWGGKDRLVPLENARVLEGEIAGARLEVLENAGHGLPLREPGKAAKIIALFLGGKKEP